VAAVLREGNLNVCVDETLIDGDNINNKSIGLLSGSSGNDKYQKNSQGK